MRLQVDYFLLRNVVTCFNFFKKIFITMYPNKFTILLSGL